MAQDDYKTKQSVVVVYTGDGKGKTSASVGLVARALGTGWKVAFVQFIKHWGVGEHTFLRDISSLYDDKLLFYKGGKGFYAAGELSEKNVTEKEHKKAAEETYRIAFDAATSGDFQLVVCDEIINAVADGLLPEEKLAAIIEKKAPQTSLCLTGRNFPARLLNHVDIATDMHKIKHHYDDKFVANKGIDF